MCRRGLIAAFLIIGLACSFMVVGCSKTERLDGTTDPDPVLSTAALGIDNSTISSSLSTTPKSVQLSIGRSLVIDASVVVPHVDSIEALTTKRLVWTAEDIFSAFDIHTAIVPHDKGAYISGDYRLALGNGGERDGNMTLLRTDVPLDYYTPALINASGSKRLEDIYPPRDLSFLPMEQARSTCLATASSLGMPSLAETRTLTLTQSILNQQKRQAIADGSVPGMFDAGSNEYSSDDEAYLFTMAQQFENIPLTPYSYQDARSGRYFAGNVIESCQDKRGYVYFVAEGIYDLKHASQADIPRIIGLDQALDKMSERYANIVADNTLTIKEIDFAYVPQASEEDDSLKLIPAWVFCTGLELTQNTAPIFVSAIDGTVF